MKERFFSSRLVGIRTAEIQNRRGERGMKKCFVVLSCSNMEEHDGKFKVVPLEDGRVRDGEHVVEVADFRAGSCCHEPRLVEEEVEVEEKPIPRSGNRW